MHGRTERKVIHPDGAGGVSLNQLESVSTMTWFVNSAKRH